MQGHPWPSIILPGDYPGLTVDGQFAHKAEDLTLNLIEDAYSLDFYKKDHLNFISKEGNKSFIISVNSKAFKPFTYMALRTTEKVHIVLCVSLLMIRIMKDMILN
jgi:hypothetical protein